MKRRMIPYDPILKQRARDLRNNSTLGEVLLWKKIKGKQFFGYDFHRQKPLLNYIVDFYCAELDLIIEVDGKYDELPHIVIKDRIRQKNLERYHLHFLRFSETEIRTQMLNVLRAIEIYVKEYELRNDNLQPATPQTAHTPDPSQEGNGILLKE